MVLIEWLTVHIMLGLVINYRAIRKKLNTIEK